MSVTRMSPYTNEEFNALLEQNQPFTTEHFRRVFYDVVTPIEGTILEYTRDLQVLVCGKCKTTLRPTLENVKQHLSARHAPLLHDLKKGKKDYYQKVGDALAGHSFMNPETPVPFNTFHYKNLPVDVNGFKCKHCAFVTPGYKQAKTHVNHAHQRKITPKHVDWDIICNVPLSMVFGLHGRKDYFIPRFVPDGAPGPAPSTAGSGSTDLSQFIGGHRNMRDRTIQAGPHKDVNKEEDFFNRTTRYYKFVEGKDIPALLRLVSKPDFMQDPTRASIYTLTLELGQEAFGKIADRSLVSRKLLNQYYPDQVEVQPFKELARSTRRGYLNVTATFLVYLFAICQDYEYEQPLLEEGWKEQMRALERTVDEATQETEMDDEAKAGIQIQILEILDAVLVKPLDCSFQANGSFANPMICYLIIISLDRSHYDAADLKSAVFRSPSTIQGVLSKLIYTARLYTMTYLCHLADNNGVENTRAFIRRRLTSGSDNWFSEFYSLRSKLKHYNYNQISGYNPLRHKDSEPELVRFKHTKIHIPKLRQAFGQSLCQLEELLFKDLLFFDEDSDHDGIIPLNLASVEDDKDNVSPLEDITTISNLKTLKKSLVRRARNPQTALHAFLARGEQVAQIHRYFDRVGQFLKLLALNVLLLSSSPLRGQELILTKFRNSTLGTLRNIFLDQVTHQIAIDSTNLSKERDTRAETKANIRFLPRRLSTVVVYYIWLVVPLVEFLSMRYLDKEVMETKLFAGPARDVSVNQLTRVLGEFFVTTFKARLNLRDYRHLMTYIIRHWVAKDKAHLLSPRVKRTMPLHEGPAPRPHRIDDQLAGHTTSIANRFYARDKNLFRNKTRDVTDRSLEFCEAYFEFFGLESAREVEEIVAADRITSPAASATNSPPDSLPNSLPGSPPGSPRGPPRGTPSGSHSLPSFSGFSGFSPSSSAPVCRSSRAPSSSGSSCIHLASTNPTGTNPSGTNLTGTNPTGTNLTGTSLQHLERLTISPPKRATVTEYIDSNPAQRRRLPTLQLPAVHNQASSSRQPPPPMSDNLGSRLRGLQFSSSLGVPSSPVIGPESGSSRPGSKRSFQERDSSSDRESELNQSMVDMVEREEDMVVATGKNQTRRQGKMPKTPKSPKRARKNRK